MKANYHTHTSRCHHASGTEREYIEAAIEEGIQILGFSDHVPYPFSDEYSSHIRMKTNELEEYVATVLRLKEEYKNDISIYLGLEVENFSKYFDDMYQELTNYPVDYLLLAAHWYGNSHKTEPYFGLYTEKTDVLENYCEQVVGGIEKGCFTYLAHPDLLNYPSDNQMYDRAMRKICRAANAYDMPLEINLRGILTHKQYPNPDFWKIAGEEKCKVVIGIDAHSVDEMHCQTTYAKAMEYVKKYHLQLLEEVELKKPI